MKFNVKKVFKGLPFVFGKSKSDIDNQRDRLYMLILTKAIKLNSSDIHILPMKDFSEVRFRIDGELVLYKIITTYDHLCLINILKLYSGLDTSSHDRVQEGQLLQALPGKRSKNEFRLSFMPSEYGEKAVIRVLGRTLVSSDRKVLGFSSDDDEKLEKALIKRNGLILLCGVTGSGKTTTIYSFLNNLKKDHVNITTIEDPIEYIVEGITQTSINSPVGYTYDSALKAVLRQDPDIIYVGEIRDSETASAAANAVLTGHMVFSSVHSDSVLGAFLRLAKLNVKPQQISEAVNIVICQKLVQKVCKECASTRRLTDDELEILGIKENFIVYSENPEGCKKCREGTNGRSLAYEIFIPSESERLILSESLSVTNLKKMLKTHGTMNDSLLQLLKKGVISIEETLKNFK